MTGLAGAHVQNHDKLKLNLATYPGKRKSRTSRHDSGSFSDLQPRRKSSIEALTYRQLILYMGFQHVLISMIGSLLFFVWGVTYIGVALMGWEITCGVLFFIGYGVSQIVPLESYRANVSRTIQELLGVFIITSVLSVLLATGTMSYGIFVAITVKSSSDKSSHVLENDATFGAGLYAALLGVVILAAKRTAAAEKVKKQLERSCPCNQVISCSDRTGL